MSGSNIVLTRKALAWDVLCNDEVDAAARGKTFSRSYAYSKRLAPPTVCRVNKKLKTIGVVLLG